MLTTGASPCQAYASPCQAYDEPEMAEQPMPAQIVLVHDEEAFRTNVTTALEAEGYTVACYPDALAAADALSAVNLVELLITRAHFRPGRSNGANLAMMLKVQKPRLRVIFVAAPEAHEHVARLGVFMLAPVAIPDLVQAVRGEIGSP
jgi:DNA-binding NtrC family response regulator